MIQYSAKVAVAFGVAVALVILKGCATADVAGSILLKNMFKPEPTVIETTVKATSEVNPDSRGRPSPIKIKLYLLTSVSVFNGSDFFQLKEQDRDLLGDDLKSVEEKVLKPSEEASLEIRLPPEETPEDGKLFLAVMAGYWDLDRAKWRATLAIEPQETTEVRVVADRTEVTLKAIE